MINDLIILAILIFALIPIFFVAFETILKFYFGMLLGIIIFNLVKYKIENIHYKGLLQIPLSQLEIFISNNEKLFLIGSALGLFILGIYFALFASKALISPANIWIKMALGLLMPFLGLHFLYSSIKNSAEIKELFPWLIDLLSSSKILNFVLDYPVQMFLLLMFLIFYRSIGILFAAFFMYLLHSILDFFKPFLGMKVYDDDEKDENSGS